MSDSRWCCSSASTTPDAASPLEFSSTTTRKAASMSIGRVGSRRRAQPFRRRNPQERGLDPTREFPKPLTDETAR